MKALSITTLILLCFTGCKPRAVSISPDINELTVRLEDVTYMAPAQKKFSFIDSPKGTHSFTGDSLSFSVTNGRLTVNGKDVGTVKAGDTVSIDGTGAVSINGQQPGTK